MVTKPRQAKKSSRFDEPCFCTSLRPLAAALMVALCNDAFALPTDPTVVSGQAAVNTAGTTGLVVNQSSPKAAIDWRTFNVGANETVRFNQPSTAAVTVNRVTTNDPSQILGKISALGSVFLINPSGIIFGRDAVVDVGSLVASTLTANTADLMSGRYVFGVAPGGSGSVRNEGRITAAAGGSVSLIGTQVSNTGTIATPGGTAGLISGGRVNIDFDGDGLVRYQVDAGVAPALVENAGLILADGGRVALQAGTRDALLDTVLSVDGVVRARSINRRNGEIYLDGGGSGVVQVSGTLDASGATAGAGGGQVRVLGESVGLFGSARIDASGETSGGTVLIGGNFQGGGVEHNATRSYIGSGASISADATGSGNGGKVIIWADDWTRFYGSIHARGGAQGGDGGFAEVSGKHNLAFWGDVNTSATLGRAGTLLLDPENLNVVLDPAPDPVATVDAGVFSAPSLGTNDTYYVSASSLLGQSNYTLQAPGTVTFASSVAFNGVARNIITVIGGTGIVTRGSTISTKGAALSLTAPTMILGAITTNDGSAAGGSLSIDASGPVTQLAAFTLGTGSLIKKGTGTLTLDQANSYTGATTLNGGTIAVSNGAGLGTSAVQVDSGTTLYLDGVAGAPSSISITGSGAGNGALLGNGTAAYAGALTLSGAAAVGATAGSTLTLGTINGGGAGSLTKLGDGTVVLGGSASYAGGTTVDAGVLTAGNATALGTAGTVTVKSGGTLNIADGITLAAGTPISLYGTLRGTGTAGYAGPVTLEAASARIDTPLAGDTLRLSAAMDGSGPLTKSGAGTLKLSGANSYTGSTAINGGTVFLNSGSRLPDFTVVSLPGATSTLDLNGTSQHIGSLDGSGTIKLGAGTLGVTQNVDGTFSGTIMDGGNLTKDGPATLTLTGPSSYTGITTVDAGILSVASSGALGTSNVTVTSGATLNIADGVALTSPSSINLAGTGVTRSGASVGALMGTGTASYSGNLVLSGVTGIGAALGDTLTLGGSRSGAGSLTKLGDGTVVLGGSASYAGGTTVDAGVLTAGNATALGTAGTVTVKSGGTLNIADGITLAAGTPISLYGTLRGTGTAGYAGPVTLEAASARIDTPLAGDTLTLSAAMDGRGSLTKSGAGTLKLSGANSYTGSTAINGGTVFLNSGSRLPDFTVVSLPGATSTLDLNGTSQHIGSLDGSGTIKLGAGTLGVTQNVDGTFSGTIMDGGNLTKDGPATLTLTGPSSYTGITTVDAGILSVASSGALGTSNVTVTSGATLNIADGVALTSPSSINLAGTGVTRSGASVGALTGTGTASYSGNLVLSGVTGIGAALGDTLTLGGSRSGAGSLTKLGDGTVVLGGSASYAGGTTVDAGVLTAGNATALGTAGTVTVKSGGTLNIADGITLAAGTPISLYGTLRGTGTAGYAGPVTLEAASARIDTPLAGDTLTLSAAMDGRGSLTKSGAGTLKLSGANSYTGSTAINGGTVFLNSGSRLPDFTVVSLPGATSTLDLNGTSQHIGSLDGSGTIKLGAGTLGVTQNVDGTFSGTIMDGGNLTKDGPATLTLTGPSSYTGITTVDAGILSVASSGALGTSNVTVTSGATLNIADGVALTSPSSINLAGTGVTRSGASVGALTGTGTASYSGNLVLSGVTGIGAALGDTLTLGGSRSGAGSLTKLGDGTVVLGGSASYAGGTTVDAGVLTAGNATALGTAGTVTVKSGGTLNIADGITLAAGTPISLYGTLRGTGTAGYAGPVTLEAASARIDTPLAGDTLTLSAAMDGSGSLTKSGAGTLTLAGPGSFAGTTRVTDGMLTLQGAGSLGGGAATVDSGATLHLDGVALTSPSSINLAGTGVNRSGASVGALMGTGTASYSGGVRLVSDAEITAAAGGTLTLNGAVTGATHVLTVDGPGVVALAGGANILGSVSQQAGSTLNLGVNQSIVTSGAQTYLGTLLGADATLRSTVGGLVSAAGSANRIAGTLTIDTAGTANLAGHFGSLNTHTGTLSLGATTIDSNALITASGNIGQTGALIVGGATTINVGDKAIALIHDGNDFGGAVSATGGTTALHDINALNVALTTGATILEAASLSASGTASSLDASTTTGMLNSSASTTGDATFHAGSALTFGASHFGGNALITASGNIGQTGALIVGGTTTINAGDKAIALIHDGNDFGGAVSATGGATALHDINALNVALTTGATILEAASLSASGTASSLDASTTTGMLNSSASTTGDATFHAGSALTFGASHIGGNALITASGNIGQTGALIVGGATTINAGDKAIALIHDGNDFGGAVSATGGTTALHDINALNVALATGATILGAASLSASGTASSLDASTTTGMLNSSVSTTGDATFHAGSALTFGASHIGGNALITASGNIGQTGALIVGGTTTINAGDKAIALIHDGNDFGGAVSATGGTTALHDINALNVALATGATILGAASLRASGTASSLDASTTTGMLNSSVSTTGDATFHAGSALTFGASHIGGSVDAHTAGPVSQSGALDVAGSVTLDAGSNRIDLSSGANMFRSPMAVTGGTTVIASDNGRLVVTLATGDTQLSANEINVSGSMALTTTTSSIRSAGPIPLGNLSITGNGSIEIVSDATMGSSYVSNASVQNASGVPNKLAIFGASIYQQAGTRISTSPNVMLVLNANGKASIDLSADASVTMSDTALSTTRLGDLLSVFSKATSTNRILMHEGTNQIQGGISAVTRADESQGTNQPKTIVAIASDTITVAPGSVNPMTSVRKPAIDADSVMLIARAINGGGGKIQTHVAATAFGDGRNIATGPTRAEDKDYAILPSIFVISEPNTTGYSFGSLDVPISVSFGAVASQAGNSLLQTIAVDPFSKDGSSGPVPVYLGTNLQPGNDPTGPIKRYLVFPIDIPKNAIRAVVVNGIKIEDSSAYDAIQTAVAEILNQVRKEQLESGFSNENVAAQLRKGVITETRVGQAAVNRFQGVASSHRCVGMMVGEMVVCAPAAGPAP